MFAKRIWLLSSGDFMFLSVTFMMLLARTHSHWLLFVSVCMCVYSTTRHVFAWLGSYSFWLFVICNKRISIDLCFFQFFFFWQYTDTCLLYFKYFTESLLLISILFICSFIWNICFRRRKKWFLFRRTGSWHYHTTKSEFLTCFVFNLLLLFGRWIVFSKWGRMNWIKTKDLYRHTHTHLQENINMWTEDPVHQEFPVRDQFNVI